MNTTPEATMSPDITAGSVEHSEAMRAPNAIPKDLAAALFVAQSKLGNVGRDANNDYYKSRYTTLAGLLDSIRPALQEAGIGFLQVPHSDNREGTGGTSVVLSTILFHGSTGQQVEWVYPIETNAGKTPSPQALGSCITYARRYTLMAILGIASCDDDDDGNAASGTGQSADDRRQRPPQNQRPQGNGNSSGNGSNPVTAVQTLAKTLHKLGYNSPDGRQMFCTWLSDHVISQFRKPGLTPEGLEQEPLAQAIVATLRDMKAAGWTAHTIQSAVTDAVASSNSQ